MTITQATIDHSHLVNPQNSRQISLSHTCCKIC
uniref:Uncharacterized protein n=1 Tax=Arundo donax TaxID=35708 RepID=A0A0A9FES0_ARUDO